MNTAQNRRPGSNPGSPSPSAAGSAITIDPMKLIQKYKFVLAASIVVGVVAGMGAHILFSKLAPRYRAHITWECSPAEESIEIINVASVDETEMERFMGTQVATMKSQLILNKVISDPRLPDLAPTWSKQYIRRGNIDVVDAFKKFEKMVSAHAVPKTFLIRLSVTANNREDAAGLVTMVQDSYLNELNTQYKRNVVSRRTALRDSIQNTNNSISDLSARKTRLVREEQIDSIDSAKSTASERMRLINAELVGIQQSLEALTVIRSNDEAQLQRDTGVEYDSALRETVEQSVMMLTFKQELKRLETALVGLQADGFQPGHRQYKQVVNQIAAHNRKIEDTREEMLRESFEARVQNTAMTLQQLRAQESELMTQKEDLREKLTELTRITQEIADIDRQIEGKITQLGNDESALADLQAASNLSSAQRVSVVESATIPDVPIFPVIYVMVPAGVFVIVGLTCGVIILFELLDQRVKSAADIRSIPKSRSLGIVMDASEDPETPDCVHTVFNDAPGSVLAEHIRQLRTGVTSAMNASGHRTLLVVGTIPQSGATAIVTNLASSCVATNLSTLIIDANMRKPSVHKVLGLGDGQGLGDVLAGECTLDSCTVDIDGGPSVLPVGTKQNRQVERISGSVMKGLLAEAREKYDIVLIDVSPAIVAGDSMTLASMVDSTMLVVRAMHEKRGQVARVARELGDCRAEFLGVLVNAVKSAAGGYMRQNIRTSFNYREIQEPTKKKRKDSAA